MISGNLANSITVQRAIRFAFLWTYLLFPWEWCPQMWVVFSTGSKGSVIFHWFQTASERSLKRWSPKKLLLISSNWISRLTNGHPDYIISSSASKTENKWTSGTHSNKGTRKKTGLESTFTLKAQWTRPGTWFAASNTVWSFSLGFGTWL